MKTAVLLALLLVVGACNSEMRAKPVGEGGILQPKAELDLCANVRCGANALCANGECSCQQGYKMCNGTCIGEASCCSAADCDANELCEDGSCTFTCSGITCESNKICYPKSEGCYCPENTKWCDTQNKCIPNDHCCGKFDCSTRDTVCSRTIESGKLCLYGNEKSCKFIGDIAKDFGLDGKTFTIGAKQFYYDQHVQLQINDLEYNMTPGMNISIEGVTFNLESLKTTGGECQDKSVDRDEVS